MKTKRDNLEREKIDKKVTIVFTGACVVNDFGA